MRFRLAVQHLLLFRSTPRTRLKQVEGWSVCRRSRDRALIQSILPLVTGNRMSGLTAVAVMVGLTSVLASILVVANRWLSVPVDERAVRVDQMLPHTNCGACGYPGCRAFAEALIRGEVLPGKCSVSTDEEQARIAAFLGIEVGDRRRFIARLACAGGNNVAPNRAHYEGERTCGAAALVSGGGKACFWGCLGLADCERACEFNAISMNENALPVVDETRCTGCGDCVEACPKDLFSLQLIDQRLWVACSSQAEGDEVLSQCEVGLSLIHISEPTRHICLSRMPSSA